MYEPFQALRCCRQQTLKLKLKLMVQVNGAYKHGTYEKHCLKRLRVMSSVNVFAMPRLMVTRPDEQDSLHRSVGYDVD